jgi:hypothetical protein
MVFQWCFNGVTMVLQWCYNVVAVLLQKCYGDLVLEVLRHLLELL